MSLQIIIQSRVWIGIVAALGDQRVTLEGAINMQMAVAGAAGNL